MDVQALIEEGVERLESYDYEKALKIGKKLIGLWHTYGYEIAARAYWELDKKKKAIKLLEEGVKNAPQVWLLWELLGNYLSDLEQYDRAFECYETALRCPDPGLTSIHVNYAIVLNRAGRSEEALQHLGFIDDSKAPIMAAAVRSDVLFSLRRYDDAVAEARRGLTLQPEEPKDVAHLHHRIAQSLWAQGDREGALREAWEAIRAWRAHKGAQWLIREIENERSERAREFEVTMEGRWPEPIDDEPRSFWVNYQVIADDEEEAIRLATRFEPENVRASLHNFEVRKRRHFGAAAPKGVHWTSGRAFFPENAD